VPDSLDANSTPAPVSASERPGERAERALLRDDPVPPVDSNEIESNTQPPRTPPDTMKSPAPPPAPSTIGAGVTNERPAPADPIAEPFSVPEVDLGRRREREPRYIERHDRLPVTVTVPPASESSVPAERGRTRSTPAAMIRDRHVPTHRHPRPARRTSTSSSVAVPMFEPRSRPLRRARSTPASSSVISPRPPFVTVVDTSIADAQPGQIDRRRSRDRHRVGRQRVVSDPETETVSPVNPSSKPPNEANAFAPPAASDRSRSAVVSNRTAPPVRFASSTAVERHDPRAVADHRSSDH
jgi:hypothetical protein